MNKTLSKRINQGKAEEKAKEIVEDRQKKKIENQEN